MKEARRVAISAPRKRIFPSLPDRVFAASSSYTYYFPEGEALRFYFRCGNDIDYVEAVNGIFTVLWEANQGENTVENPTDTFSKYWGKYEEETGRRPDITKPLVFFQRHPVIAFTRVGKITSDGQANPTG